MTMASTPRLQVLTRIGAGYRRPTGEVWTVAPAFEQSGVGHCISYTHPTMIAELAPAALPPKDRPPIA